MTDKRPKLPGRIGDPTLLMAFDPRLDPRIAAMMQQMPPEMSSAANPAVINPSYEECCAYYDEQESEVAASMNEMMTTMPAFEDIDVRKFSITGDDGADIELTVYRPASAVDPLPGVVYIHGGGMVILSAKHPPCVRWAKSLAAQGQVVIAVEFRNGAGKLGRHPFPAGLNDCAAATRWVGEHRAELGISSLTVSGESGGGNLTLATVLKAKQDGWINLIDGVYALCPCIFGDYVNAAAYFASWQENETYFMSIRGMSALATVYDPTSRNASNPLAWPYFADADLLSGLPPHVISVNELDPLRDEGLAYYKKLAAAGVSVVARTVNGTPHGGDFALVDIVPEVVAATRRDIYGFACSLTSAQV